MLAVGIGIAAALAAAVFVAQAPEQPDQTVQESDHKIVVVASFYPLYEFAKNVGGDKAEVASFVPIGVEPHDWEPSTGDIMSLKSSDIFVYNGADFEPYVTKLMNSGEYPNLTFVETIGGIELIKSADENEDEHEMHSEFDPHIWLDPVLAKRQVTTIKDSMVAADPQNSEYYEGNARAYMERLDALDTKIREGLSECKKDTFMPFHRAFGYFAARYDLNMFALSGMAPESEATAAELGQFVDFIKEHDVKVVFSEDLVDPRLAQVLADEAGTQVMILSPIEGLTEDELKSGSTYFTKMEQNLNNLRVALECQ